MDRFSNLQILGAAIATIGIMFVIIYGISFFRLVPMPDVPLGTAVVSLLMSANGYLIMLFGIMMNPKGRRAAIAF